MKLNRVSSVYEAEPMYYESQDWFLNCVVSVDTRLPPVELLRLLKVMEIEIGRRPAMRYGPRVIDLDVLFYGEQIVSVPGLEIPHPKIQERAFVLVPLNEIRPELVHPVLKKTVSELARELKTEKRVIKKPGLLSDHVSG